MDNCAFNIYRGLKTVSFMPPSPVENVSSDDRKPTEDILDLIYCVDPMTNMPSGSIEQYLSEKTNDQVRTFIEQKILIDLPDTGVSVPSSMREDLLKLDSEFIAKTSRNRFESKEEYEARVQSYFDEIEQDKKKQALLNEFRKKYQESKS